MIPHDIYNIRGFFRENRLTPFENADVLGASPASGPELPISNGNVFPSTLENLNTDAAKRRDNRKESRRKENDERSNELAPVEEKIDAVLQKQSEKTKTISDRLNKMTTDDAEQFMIDAANTLQTDEERHVYEAGINALTSSQKLAMCKSHTLIHWSVGCEQPFYLPKPIEQSIGLRTFAQNVVFLSFKYDLGDAPEDFALMYERVREDFALHLTADDLALTEEGLDAAAKATKTFLDEHPDVNAVIKAKQMEDEADLRRFMSANEVVTENDAPLDKAGSYPTLFLSAQQRRKSAREELPTLVALLRRRKKVDVLLQESKTDDGPTVLTIRGLQIDKATAWMKQTKSIALVERRMSVEADGTALIEFKTNNVLAQRQIIARLTADRETMLWSDTDAASVAHNRRLQSQVHDDIAPR
jgi:hypothetical protein